mgnify:CR=1 FL=1
MAEGGEMIKALGLDGFDERFGIAVHLGNSDRAQDDFDVYAGEDRVKSATELRVVISDQLLNRHAVFLQMHAEVPGLLGDPGLVGMRSGSGYVDAPRSCA